MLRRSRQLVATATLAALLPGASTALAVTHTWNGGNSFGPNSMNNGLNWSGGTPVSGSSNLTLVFPGSSSSSSPNQDIANPLELQSLQLNGFYSLTGSAYRFRNLGAAPTLVNTSFATIANAIDFQDPTTVTTSSSTLFLNGVLTGGTVTFSSSLNTGTQTIAIGGTGTNTIGAIVTNNASLDLQKTGALAGTVTLNGGTLSTVFANALASNTNLTVNTPAVALSPTQYTYANPAIRFNASQAINQLTLNGGQIDIQTSFLTVGGTITATGSSALVGIGGMTPGGIDLGGASGKSIQVTNAADTLVIDGTVTNGSFTKVGAGTLEMHNSYSGNSTYTGQNTVSAGTLKGDAAAIGNNVLNNSLVELTGGTVTGTISGSGSVVINGFASYASLNSYTGGTTINAGSTLNADSQYLHGTITGAGSGGSIQLNDSTNQTLNALLNGTLYIGKTGIGVVTLPNASSMSGGNVTVYGGGLRFGASGALGTAQLYLGAGPSTPVSLESIGSTTHANQLFIGGPLDIQGSGNLTFTDTGDKNTNYAFTHNSSGNTTLAGKFTLGAAGSVVVNSGSLTLGDVGVVGGFTAAGPVTVNSGGSLTLRSLNFISLPDVTLAGGTLNTPNGYAIPLGAALQGNGGVSGRVASANGSTILANGNLAIGDGSNVAGVNLDGELYTNQFNVTLNDSNQAVIGSLTRVGTATADGTLTSTNGLVVNFGRNLAGRGTIASGNTLAQAIIMNGDASGDSLSNPLQFTGYVKGVGTFNNVSFGGTFAPGLSPALLTVGSIAFMFGNTLDMEIGGLNRGSQYDAIDATGGIGLSGTLKLSLINGFVPSLGNQFDLFNGPTSGTFSNFNFAPLPAGLQWDTSLLYSQGIVQVVVPEPTTLLGSATISCVALLRRRRA